VWIALMVALTLVNYGFPIYQLASLRSTSVPAIYVGGGQ
jgi:cytochrome c oxidase subunit 1